MEAKMRPVNALLVVLICLSMGSSVSESQTTDANPAALMLLRESVQMSDTLDPDTQAAILLTSADSALHVDKAAAKDWAQELFRFAHNSMSSTERAPAEKNALVVLSKVDPAESARLFKLQDLPSPDVAVYEDPRIYAAGPVYEGLWKQSHLKSLSTISNLSNWLGSTGQYPYAAIGDIVQKAVAGDPAWVTKTLSDAQKAFRRDPGYDNSPDLYAELLIQTHTLVDKRLEHDGLAELVQRLEDPLKKSKSHVDIKFIQDGKETEVQTEEDATLYKILPLLRSVDPLWTESVLHKHPALSNLKGLDFSMPFTEQAVVSAGGEGGNSASRAAMDELTARRVSALGKKDPDGALKSAEAIQTQYARMTAILAILPAYALANSAKANKMFDQTWTESKALPEDGEKLKLLVSLSKAAFALHRPNDGVVLANSALDLGEKVFKQDREIQPAKAFFVTAGADQLFQVATLIGEHCSDYTGYLSRIRHGQEEDLKAAMLVFVARGLINRAHPGTYS
jgi:hypothetical protein